MRPPPPSVCNPVCGVLDLKVVEGSVDGEIYCDFIEMVLLPHLMPVDGINPHSIVVLDNCSFHHAL